MAELYKKVDGKYVYANQVAAFEAFANTKIGKAYLAQFASKGQVIAGVKFDKDGKNHKNEMDLNIGAVPTVTGSDGTASLSQDDNGRWQFDVNFSAGADTYDNVGALTHELFVHVEHFVGDINDDGKKNYTNMPDWINRDFSPRQRHHQYERHLSRTNRKSSMWLTDGFSLMQIINNQTKKKSYEKVWYDLFDGL